MRNDGGSDDSIIGNGTGGAGAQPVTISSQDKQIDRILLRSLILLFKDRQEDILEELVKITTDLFPIKSMIIFTIDEASGSFVSSGVFGYPPERVPVIKDKITYTPEEIKAEIPIISRPLGRFSRIYLAEMFRNVNEKDIIETLSQGEIDAKRKDEGAWHPLDRAVFYFIDRFGKEIGYIYITSTTDGRMLSPDSIAGLDIIASVASAAVELTRVRQREQTQLETQERRAAQIGQILAVVTSILTISDLSSLIDKVLTSIDDLFSLKAVSITLYDPMEGCFKWVGFSGYTEEQMARARKLRVPKEVIERDTKPEFRIGYLAHFKPAEKTIPDDFAQYFVFNDVSEAIKYMDVPRKSPTAWHVLDDLAFLVMDRNGKAIGAIYVDEPLDGKIPSRENIEMIEIFVSLVAIAIENSTLYAEAHLARENIQVLNRLMFHDLMNYSMAIRGYLDLAAAQQDAASMDGFVDRALRQIDQTAELVEKVRKLSTIRSADRGNMLRIDLGRTISAQSTKTASLFPSKKVAYSFDFEAEEAFVMANDLLPDLFHNIFMNAIKFDMRDAVSIDVGLRAVSEKAGESGTRSWRVSISDHGPGIPDEKKRSIFLGVKKPATHEPTRGMGLGLSIVKSLVDLYGGKVWVEDREPNHPEKGAVFMVELPQA
jgi:signal transduction histidine kinase